MSLLPAFAKAVYTHWSMENSLRWVLGMMCREDELRIRKNHRVEHFSSLRKIAFTCLNNDTKRGNRKGKRKKVGWEMIHLWSKC